MRLFSTKCLAPNRRIWYEYHFGKKGRKQLYLVLNPKRGTFFYYPLSLPLLIQIFRFANLFGKIYNVDRASKHLRFENINKWKELLGEELFKKVAGQRKALFCYKGIDIYEFKDEKWTKTLCKSCDRFTKCHLRKWLWEKFDIR